MRSAVLAIIAIAGFAVAGCTTKQERMVGTPYESILMQHGDPVQASPLPNGAGTRLKYAWAADFGYIPDSCNDKKGKNELVYARCYSNKLRNIVRGGYRNCVTFITITDGVVSAVHDYGNGCHLGISEYQAFNGE